MPFIGQLIASALISSGVWIGMSTYFPLSWLPQGERPLGTAFTQLSSTDRLSTFPTVHNANLALTANLSETANFSGLVTSRYGSSTMFSCSTCYFGGSATSSITNGVLTLISPLGASSGGTASSSLTANQVMIGNGTSGLKVIGFGTSGQFLTSGGNGVAPSWTTSALNQAADYTWTGHHIFSSSFSTLASSTYATVTNLSIANVPYTWTQTQGASSTVLSNNGSGQINWVMPDWRLLGQATANGSSGTTTVTGIPTTTEMRIVIDLVGITSSADNISVRFNGDAGANYAYRLAEISTSSPFVRVATGDNRGLLGGVTSQGRRTYILNVFQYSTSDAKFFTWQGGINATTSVASGNGQWNNLTDAISQVNVIVDSGTSGRNIVANSRVTVYGR